MAEEFVYHIVPREEWAAAEAAGIYRPPSLAAQGFVHCSTREQVVETGNRFFHGQEGLVLLCIKVARLRAPLRYEPPGMPGHARDAAQSLFPHLYGPLEPDAVARVLPFPSRADGSFALPPQLSVTAPYNPVVQATQLTEETAQRLLGSLARTNPVRRPYAGRLAIVVGLALLTGLLLRRLAGKE